MSFPYLSKHKKGNSESTTFTVPEDWCDYSRIGGNTKKRSDGGGEKNKHTLSQTLTAKRR